MTQFQYVCYPLVHSVNGVKNPRPAVLVEGVIEDPAVELSRKSLAAIGNGLLEKVDAVRARQGHYFGVCFAVDMISMKRFLDANAGWTATELPGSDAVLGDNGEPISSRVAMVTEMIDAKRENK